MSYSTAKYWEMIADGLDSDGWWYGVSPYLTRDGRTMHCADAHHDEGWRYVVHAEELAAAFLELDPQCRAAMQGATL